MPGEVPRVIVVEDDESMSRAIERILRAGGFVTESFASAEAALEADAATTPDCLVLDISLPGMSGFDLYRRLAPAGEPLKAIFITAHDEPAVRREAERLDAGGYLPKPFSGRALLDAVIRAVARDR